MNKLSIFLFVVLVVFFCLCGKKTPEPVVELIDGIEYVHNPDKPLNPEKTVVFEEELTVSGEDEETGEIYLYRPGRYTVDDAGNVYVTDMSDQAIKVFDKNGKYIRTIGKKGQGPGEFQNAGDMDFLPDGKLIVMDWENNRTSIFSPDGKFIKSCKWNGFMFDLYMCTDSSFTSNENIYGNERKMYIKTFDFDANVLLSFGEFTPYKSHTLQVEGTMYAISLPFPTHSIFAADRSNLRLYHCLPGEYSIEVFDKTGKLFRKIDRPYEPVRVTQEDVEDYRSGFENDDNPVFAKMIKEVEFPEFKPSISNMIVDDKKNLWVGTYEKKTVNDKELFAYDLFDEKGFYITKIWNEFTPGFFKNGKMYRRFSDKETGITVIQRFNVKWIEN